MCILYTEPLRVNKFMGKKSKDHYVDSEELENVWINWANTNSKESWESILEMVYKICFGATLKFSPKEESEREEMAHDAFAATIIKIKDGKLKYIAGRGRAFNLITTAIIRHIQSKKNREKAGRRVYEKFLQKQMQSNDNLRLLKTLHKPCNHTVVSDPNDDTSD